MKSNEYRRNYFIAVATILLLMIGVVAAWAFLPSPTQAATPEPDRIATGVAEAKAVAATLTADAPEVDRVATDVAVARAAIQTLIAEGSISIQQRIPDASPTTTKTVSVGGNYGPTDHCPARSGYATIELRNIVANVKSLNFFADGVHIATVPFGKYECVYLEDGKYVFQWKNESKQKQSNARSFTVNGSDAWYSGSKRPDGIRNPYDAWLDAFKPTKTPTPLPTETPTPTP